MTALYPLAEFTDAEQATLDRFDDAPPPPESWIVLRHHAHRLHVHEDRPCCLSDGSGGLVR